MGTVVCKNIPGSRCHLRTAAINPIQKKLWRTCIHPSNPKASPTQCLFSWIQRCPQPDQEHLTSREVGVARDIGLYERPYYNGNVLLMQNLQKLVNTFLGLRQVRGPEVQKPSFHSEVTSSQAPVEHWTCLPLHVFCRASKRWQGEKSPPREFLYAFYSIPNTKT